MEWLENKIEFDSLKGIGHRVVRGMKHTKSDVISIIQKKTHYHRNY